MKRPMQPDSDRPLNSEEDDLFGFVGIASRLAPAVLKTFETDGMVIGLEGPWGAGKTTLLNFLRQELDKSKPQNVHVINIAPWLSGDLSNLVSSLLRPIADIVDKHEKQNITEAKSFWRRAKKTGSDLGDLLRYYGIKTGRTLAPAARFAEYFIPGAKIAGDALDISSQYLEKMQRPPTTAEMKIRIARKISELDIGFIVVLDDLDRLEPEQAVEVVRLVRSVADFPKITYLMCYDRKALAHALKSGLNLEDGDQFLQKIVQLTFSIPLPEPFDLRGNFLTEALEIFEEVTGENAEGDLLDDIRSAVDREGSALSTPREVKLALNGLRFVYPSIKDDVYFPDICRLHLIKTTRPNLYHWIEEYLSVRSVLVTSDTSISKYERNQMGERLKELLPAEDSSSTRSIWNMRRFIPGIRSHDEPEERVFSSASIAEVRDMISLRRLGSPIHYRYYFALSYPKTVMPDNQFNGLLALARDNVAALTEKLISLSKETRSSGKSWFEHVLDRLDHDKVSELDASTLSGIIQAISDGMDSILVDDKKPHPFSLSVASRAEGVVRECFKRLSVVNTPAFLASSKRIASDCPSMNWLVGHFFRSEIHAHGLIGDRPPSPERRAFGEGNLHELLGILKDRASTYLQTDHFPDMPELAAYLYGWRDLSGLDEPKKWVENFCESDERFLFLLDKLRSWAVSDKVYYPLQKSAASVFLDWERTVQRLEELANSVHAEKAKEILTAIEQGRH